MDALLYAYIAAWIGLPLFFLFLCWCEKKARQIRR